MPRLRLCLLIALLLATVTGCGSSTTPADSSGDTVGGPEDESAVNASTDADDSQLTEQSGHSQIEPEPSDSTNVAVESGALKQAMIDITFEHMKAQDPTTELDVVRDQVEQAIAQIRKDVPEFLVVSAEIEKKLAAGTPIEGSAKKIAEAEGFFSEYGLQLSGLVTSLLPQHKAGDLSPVHTELLAQLIGADKKKAEDALSN